MTYVDDLESAIDIARSNPGTVVLSYPGEEFGPFRVSRDLDEIMMAIMGAKATPIYYFVMPKPDPASDIASTDKEHHQSR